MTTEAEARVIAKGLDRHSCDTLRRCDPAKVEASIATLLSLCLNDLAETRKNNTVYLSAAGLAVRRVLEAEASSGSAVSHQQGAE